MIIIFIIFMLGFLLWPAAALVLGLVFSGDKIGAPQLLLLGIVVLIFISSIIK